jgi:hypothetical protein
MLAAPTAAHAQFFFSTGNVIDRMAMASRPTGPAGDEIEAADDFALLQRTFITGGSFTGLLPAQWAGSVESVTIEIYRVFPFDSNNPPSGNVPTRVNSPSDVAFDTRTSGSGLNFTTTTLRPRLTTGNSVLNGIHPLPNQTTGGDGRVSGQEVRFDFTFTTPFDLPADHYFFVPQVSLANGDFFWLSATRPITAPGTPFAPDLQAWIRNEALSPDWLRVGTDIVGGQTPPTFNGAFSLIGTTAVPEPSTLLLVASGLGLVALVSIRRRGMSS